MNITKKSDQEESIKSLTKAVTVKRKASNVTIESPVSVRNKMGRSRGIQNLPVSVPHPSVPVGRRDP